MRACVRASAGGHAFCVIARDVVHLEFLVVGLVVDEPAPVLLEVCGAQGTLDGGFHI